MCSVETWNLFCNWVIALARFSLHQYCIFICQKLQSKFILLKRVMIKIMIIYITSYISIDWLLWQDFRCINTAFSFAVDCSQSIYWRKKWSKLWLKWKSNFFIMVLTIANPHHDQPGSLLIPLNSPPGTSQHCSQGRFLSGIPHNSKSIVTDWVQTYLKEA